MRRIYGNMSIARKMTAVFLAICFVALSLSSVTVSYAAMKNINRRTETFARAVNAQVLSNMEHFMESYQGLMLAVLVDSDVLSALARDAVPVSEQAGYRAQINRLLFRLTKMQPDLIYAGIALKNGQTFQTGATGETADLLSIMERDWMKQLLEDPGTFTVVPMHDGEYTNRYGHGQVISAVQKLYGPSRQYVGVIILDVETRSIVDLGNENILQENLQGIRVVVENGRHQVIYDSGSEKDMQRDAGGFMLFELPDQKYITLSETLPGSDIVVHTIYPKATLLLLRRDLVWVTGLSVLVCALLSFLCAALFSRSFTRPITRLQDAIRQAENETYAPVEGSFNQDEFGELIRHYNRMVERIEYLIRQVYQKDLQKKSAQLLALQTQINPHMMFNTLESIRMKALIAGNKDVAEMTSLLGKMFRMTLENVNERHTVKNELDYVRSFLQLQNRRYRVENTLDTDVPEELMDIPCMVILFQPLVENSLSHGSPGPDTPLHIRIRGSRVPDTDRIVFTVSDDGTGMDPDRLMLISDRLESIRQGDFSARSNPEDGRQHIGLENIAKRLQLQYGSDGYLRIVRSNETGTVIEICIRDAAGDVKEESAWTSES